MFARRVLHQTRLWGSCLIALGLLLSSTARADEQPVCVAKAGVKMRRGPGPQFAVSWAVPKYMPLLATGQKGAWLKVQDLDGATHWINASAVSHKIECAVVKTKHAKLRRGPGFDQPPAELSSVDKFTPFRKVDRDGEWVRVKDSYAATYWVHETSIWIPVTRMHVSF